MAEGPVKVAVLSPQPVVVEGLVSMLAHHADRFVVVDAPTAFDDPEPDVALYDVLGLFQGDGEDLDYLVQKTATAVFAVGRPLRPDLLTQALNRGADGFFDLGVTEDELCTAIESAMTGWQVGDTVPDPMVGSSTSEQRSQRLGQDVGLSPRQTRILALIAQGLTNEEIASRDFLSANTVKTYIRSAYQKIGVTNRSQAIVWAVNHGFATEVDTSSFDES